MRLIMNKNFEDEQRYIFNKLLFQEQEKYFNEWMKNKFNEQFVEN
jgi:hypothetical protein